jgi:hypothetical protein
MKLGKMKSGKQILIEVILPFLFCAILSFFTWWAVISLTDPSCNETVTAEEILPINAEHVSEYIISAGEGDVLITGPRSLVAICLSEGVSITVDLSSAFPDGIKKPGSYNIAPEHLKVILPASLGTGELQVKTVCRSVTLTFTEVGGV